MGKIVWHRVAPYLVIPSAFIIGTAGYLIESHISGNHVRGREQERSILEKRQERMVAESVEMGTLQGTMPSHSVLSCNLPNSDKLNKTT